MMDRIQQRLQFSKLERYLIRNQADPFVARTHSKKHDVSDSNEYEPKKYDEIRTNSRYYQTLAEGVYHKSQGVDAVNKHHHFRT